MPVRRSRTWHAHLQINFETARSGRPRMGTSMGEVFPEAYPSRNKDALLSGLPGSAFIKHVTNAASINLIDYLKVVEFVHHKHLISQKMIVDDTRKHFNI